MDELENVDPEETANMDESPTVQKDLNESDTVIKSETEPGVNQIRGEVAELQELGEYRILKVLGKGGFGVVYLGVDRKLDRHVAIKVLAPHLALQPGYVERFDREARSAAKLKHPNIVSMHATGEDKGVHYLVMEYVEGRTVQEMVHAGPMSEKRVLKIISEVAGGLGYAHDHGIIHRDLKPGNIMLDETDRVVIMDFGLARPEQAGGTLTESDMIVGTPVYMSPEQAQVSLGNVDRRSDVYSLGVVLYQLVTGKLPFVGETPVAILRKVIDEDPEAPRKAKGSISKDLEAIILKAMEKDREKRYQTAEDLQEDIENYLAGKPIKAKKRTALGQGVKWAKRNKILVGSVLAASVLAGSVIGVIARMSAEQQRRQSQALVAKSQEEVKKRDSQLAAYEADTTGTWEEKPFIEDDFSGAELGDAWEIRGDILGGIQGWKMEDGALTYFGTGGGGDPDSAVWLKEPLVGDFRLELEFELPEWTEEKLDEAVKMNLAPSPPSGVRSVPFREDWSEDKGVSIVKDTHDMISGVKVDDVMYMRTTDLGICLRRSEPFSDWVVYLGGDGPIRLGVPSALYPPDFTSPKTGVVTKTGVIENGETLRGGPWDGRCDFGTHTASLVHEGNRLRLLLDSEYIGETTLECGEVLWIGLIPGPAAEETLLSDTGCLYFAWRRFLKVEVFRRLLAKKSDPLTLAETCLSKGNFASAEQTFGSALDLGLSRDLIGRAHIGRAKALVGLGRFAEAETELRSARDAKADAVSKSEVIHALTDAGQSIQTREFLEDEEIPQAWKMASAWRDGRMLTDLARLLTKDHAEVLATYLRDRDAHVQSEAAKILGSLSAGDQVPELIEALSVEDYHVRESVADALAQLGAKQAIPRIIELLQDDKVSVNLNRDMLDSFQTSDVIPPLLEYLRNGTSKQRQGAVGALGRIVAPEAVPELLECLRDKDPAMRTVAVEALKCQRSRQSIPQIAALLKDEDVGVRREVCLALGQMLARQTIPQLIEALNDPSIRGWAAMALGHLQARQSIPQLLELLDSMNSCSDLCILDTLGELHAQEAIPALLDALRHEDPAVRDAAAQALGDLGCKECVPRLIQLLEDDSPAVRMESVFAIGQLRARECIPGLIQILEDEDQTMQDEVSRALVSIAGREDIPVFVKLLDSNVPAARSTAIDVLSHMGVLETSKAMVFLEDKDDDVRISAIEALGRLRPSVGAKEAADRLTTLLKDENWLVSVCAIRALGAVQGKQSIPVILKLLQDTNDFVQHEAARVLSSLGAVESVPRLLELSGLSGTEDYSRDPLIFLRALSELNCEEATVELVRRVSEYSGGSRDVTLAEYLANRGHAEMSSVLVGMLYNEYLPDAERAARALAELGAEKLPEEVKIDSDLSWFISRSCEEGARVEIAAIGNLEQQDVFSLTLDEDGDGQGEYPSVEDIRQRQAFRRRDLPILCSDPYRCVLMGTKGGYFYELTVGEGACSVLKGVDAKEKDFLVVAWPKEYGIFGKKSFCVDASGMIRSKDVGGQKPNCDAVRGPGAWPEAEWN